MDVKENIFYEVVLGSIALSMLVVLIPFQDFLDWFVDVFIGAIVATFFFSPLISWMTREEKTIQEKSLFITGAVIYVALYFYLADFMTFVETTLEGIVIYVLVSTVVKVLWSELSKYLP